MANARELKERMASIQETRKITNAMYLISSSKMKQARKKLADTEPFFFAMQAEISRILRHVPDMHSHFFDIREKIPAEEMRRQALALPGGYCYYCGQGSGGRL